MLPHLRAFLWYFYSFLVILIFAQNYKNIIYGKQYTNICRSCFA